MAEGVKLARAIRDALQSLGVEAETSAVRDWVVRTYPHLDEAVQKPTFSSTLSNQRKAKREQAAGGDQPTEDAPLFSHPGPAAPAPAAAPPSAPAAALAPPATAL